MTKPWLGKSRERVRPGMGKDNKPGEVFAKSFSSKQSFPFKKYDNEKKNRKSYVGAFQQKCESNGQTGKGIIK